MKNKCFQILNKLHIKKSNGDILYDYDFNAFSADKIPLIFMLSAVYIPYGLSLLLSVVFLSIGISIPNYINLAWELINIVSLTIGFYLIWTNSPDTPREMVNTGVIAFYIFAYIQLISIFIYSIVVSLIGMKNISLSSVIVTIIVDLASFLIVILICPRIRNRMIRTIKEDYKRYLIICLIFIIIGTGLSLAFGAIQNLITKNTSINQNNLNDLLKSVTGIILLFFLSVMIAPLIEEVVCRHSIFMLTGNKFLGFLTSFFYFIGLHVTSGGLDWQSSIGYIGGSFILCAVFYYSNFNVTYSITVHSMMNLVAFIILVEHVPGLS